MTEDELKPHLNPYSFLSDPLDVFDAVAVPVPPGTKAPPRPPGRERVVPPPAVTPPPPTPPAGAGPGDP
jgi:hypothetical protein